MSNTIKFLRREQAAQYLSSHYGFGTRASLAKWAVTGHGPKFRLLGRFPVYAEADLDAWALKRLGGLQSSTSDKAGAANRDAHLLANLHRAEADRSAA